MNALFLVLALLGNPDLYPDAEDFVNGDGVTQGSLDMNGEDIIIDADGDSRWEHGTDDQLQLYLNSGLVAAFTATKLGIGEDTPLGQLHLKVSDVGAIAPSTEADNILIEEASSAGVTIISGHTSNGWLIFGDKDDLVVGAIKYDHNANSFSIFSNNAFRYSIDSSGNHDLKDANVTNIGDIDVDSISADGTSVNYEDVNILELTQEDVGATCTLGQIRYDTGGATQELCICQATDTWMCVALAAGPAD